MRNAFEHLTRIPISMNLESEKEKLHYITCPRVSRRAIDSYSLGANETQIY